MKTPVFITVIVMICFLDSCITIRSRKVDDGTMSLTKEDSTLIFPFDLSVFNQKESAATVKDIHFRTMDADNLHAVIPQKKYTWLLIGASWCPISEKALKVYSRLITEYPEDSIQLIFLSQDMNLKILQQEIFESDYNRTPFLMDAKKYGTDEVFKQEKFIREFNKQIPRDYFKGGGVPCSVLFDQNSTVLLIKKGDGISGDTLRKYTNLK
jgi:hypothetical protein